MPFTLEIICNSAKMIDSCIFYKQVIGFIILANAVAVVSNPPTTNSNSLLYTLTKMNPLYRSAVLKAIHFIYINFVKKSMEIVKYFN